jgi:integrase
LLHVQGQPHLQDPKNGQTRIKGQRYPITYYGIGSNKRKWKKAGVDAKFHALRHTTGMRTLRKTGNLKVVQKILGHSDIAITANSTPSPRSTTCAPRWKAPTRRCRR